MSVQIVLKESKGYELAESIEILPFENGMSAQILGYRGRYRGKYWGSIKCDGETKIMHGIGRFVRDNGGVFEGQFKDNKLHGYCREYWSGGYTIG